MNLIEVLRKCARFLMIALCVPALGCQSLSLQKSSPNGTPVWIDTDPAVGVKERDVDDGLALIQSFHSPELEIKGISVVFGNASLDQVFPIGKEIARRFGPKGVQT